MGYPKFTLFFIIVSIVAFVSGTYMHEVVHKQIFDMYDIESEIGFNIVSAYAKATSSSNHLSSEEIREMKKLHTLNEIVAYNLQQFLMIIMAGFFVIIIIMEFNVFLREKKNENIEELKSLLMEKKNEK